MKEGQISKERRRRKTKVGGARRKLGRVQGEEKIENYRGGSRREGQKRRSIKEVETLGKYDEITRTSYYP